MYAVAVWSADYFCAAVWVTVVGGDSLRPTTISALFCLAFAAVASENRHWRPPAHRLPFLLTPLTFSNTGRRDKSRQQPVLRDFWLHVLGSTLAFITSLSLPNLSCHRNISFIRSITHVRRFGIHVFFLCYFICQLHGSHFLPSCRLLDKTFENGFPVDAENFLLTYYTLIYQQHCT